MKTLGRKQINILSKCGENPDLTDHHSGFNLIESNESITIVENKQMINYDGLTIDGDLNIDGDLILR